MISKSEAAHLQDFHAKHFPGKPAPSPTSTSEQDGTLLTNDTVYVEEEPTGLGYYSDGTRRTLTDEQIKMFRHSEIQRLLNERRAMKEREERQKRKIDRVHTNSATFEAKKRPHYDDPSPNQVDTLLYDEKTSNPAEAPNSVTRKATTPFIWPQLRDT